jgi:hypothetical protein
VEAAATAIIDGTLQFLVGSFRLCIAVGGRTFEHLL